MCCYNYIHINDRIEVLSLLRFCCVYKLLSGQFQRFLKFQITCIRTAWFQLSSVTIELFLFQLTNDAHHREEWRKSAAGSTAPCSPQHLEHLLKPTPGWVGKMSVMCTPHLLTVRNDTGLRSRYPRTDYGADSHSPGARPNMEWPNHMLTGCRSVFQMTSDFTLQLAVGRCQFHTVQLKTSSLFFIV